MPRTPFDVPLVRSYSDFNKQQEKRKDEILALKLKDCIVLSDDDDDDERGDSEASTPLGSPSPLKRSSESISPESSSNQTTPSPKKPKLIFGKEARPWSTEEFEIIAKHLSDNCDRVHLKNILDRAPSSVAYQVERLLRSGVQGVTKKAK